MHSFTSALDGGEWSASRSDRFTPREKAPGTQWTGGWVGPRAGLDTLSKRKLPSPRPGYEPGHPIFQPIVNRYIQSYSVSSLNDESGKQEGVSKSFRTESVT
jgi:hypothetical protein